MELEAFSRPKRLPGFAVFEQINLKHSAEFGVELSDVLGVAVNFFSS